MLSPPTPMQRHVSPRSVLANVLLLCDGGAVGTSDFVAAPVWKPDNSVSNCSLCSSEFKFIGNRRHHCRQWCVTIAALRSQHWLAALAQCKCMVSVLLCFCLLCLRALLQWRLCVQRLL